MGNRGSIQEPVSIPLEMDMLKWNAWIELGNGIEM